VSFPPALLAPFFLQLAAGALLNAAAAVLAYRRRSVDGGGAAAGSVLGTLIFGFAGPLFWVILVLFFVTATAAGLVRRRDKQPLGRIHEKGERRDFLQVLANGGLGTAVAVVYGLTRDPAWAAAFAVSFAASNADTWGSEVGMLARRPPVSLVTLKPLPRGISGGVTLLGTGASLAGSLAIALVFALVNAGLRILPAGYAAVAGFVGVGGFAASLVDSLLGATVQARYAAAEGSLTERRADATGSPNRLVHGLAFVNNDAVNFVSGAIATLAAFLAAPLVL
jgi:uncharacterized protein (TIGR00297 family)